MRASLFVLTVALQLGSASAASASCIVGVTQQPLVMRVGKDEFRIVFGINGDQCRNSGCTGVIQYQAAWQADDGFKRVDSKQLDYNIPGGANRSIAVDRSYFDTGEAKHSTEVVWVSVDDVSCSRP